MRLHSASQERRVVASFMLSVLLSASLPVAIARPAWCDPLVKVNEVLADPARDWDGDQLLDSADDEWVEIVNTGDVPADLTGLRLGDLSRAWAYGFSGALAVEGHIVVYGSASKAWQRDNGVAAFGLRLANTGDDVALWKVTATDTVLVDQYTYADHEADDDRSSGRRPDGSENWELYDGLNEYTGGTPPLGNGCVPTPDRSNNCATPVEPSTWGRIKAQYQPEP